eukprot:gene12326-12461_t
MDMYIHKGIDGDPYWARVWPSAISLAQQLLQRPHLVAGKRVADLGAGLGVAGIAAALAGAREVLLLDREPLALHCGLINPPNRTADNRQRFVELLSAAQPGALLLEESGVYQCAVNQLDPEMVGGVKGESVAVQFMAFRYSVGNDTVGVKL